VLWRGWSAPDDPQLAAWLLTTWALFVILGLHGPLATRGPELGSHWMGRMLPVGWGPPRRGSLLASALYPVMGLIWCLVAAAWSRDLVTVLAVLGIGSGGLVALLGSARWLSERSGASTSVLPAWTWAATWLTVLGLTNGAL
jgi:hypothetical protein